MNIQISPIDGVFIDIWSALASLVPNPKCHIKNDKIIEWNSEEKQPTEAEIDAEVIRLQAEYDAQEYARTRQPKYPNIGDQLDDLYHKGAFSDEMAVKIKAVKDAHPKSE